MQGKINKIGQKNEAGCLKKRQIFFCWVISAFLCFCLPPSLYADHDSNFAYIGQGFFRILSAAFQIPRYLLYKTFSGPPGLGTIDGLLTGTFSAVAAVSQGLLEIGRGVAPYGKYALFFI